MPLDNENNPLFCRCVTLSLSSCNSTFDPDYLEPDSDQTQTITFNGP